MNTQTEKSTISVPHRDQLASIPWVDPHWIEFALKKVNPLWSASRVKAKVLLKKTKSEDVVSLSLAPNKHWQGFKAGQFVCLKISIDNIVYERCYSMSVQSGNTIRLTIKRKPGGLVSNYIHDRLRAGDIVELSQAQGNFNLQDTPTNNPILLIAGGIGITPLYSILTDRLLTNPDNDVVLIYFARTANDFIFDNMLNALQSAYDNFSYHKILTRRIAHNGNKTDANTTGHLSKSKLDSLVPDFAGRQTFVCGPTALNQIAHKIYSDRQALELLQLESFAAEPNDVEVTEQEIHFVRSGKTTRSTAGTLLEIAEKENLPLRSACRMGICNTCSCTKLSGTTKNINNGAIDSTPNSNIRLCVSQAVGPIHIDL